MYVCLHFIFPFKCFSVSGVLSLNAGLFASICLASRLHSALHSFATVTFAVELFALWPALRRNLRVCLKLFLKLYTSKYIMLCLKLNGKCEEKAIFHPASLKCSSTMLQFTALLSCDNSHYYIFMPILDPQGFLCPWIYMIGGI